MSIVGSNTQSNNLGFVYSVTNQRGVKSHLVGTIHVATKEMAENERLFKTLDKVKHLYTEMGCDIQLFGVYTDIGFKKGAPDRRGYTIDHSLTLEAIGRNIVVHKLDSNLEKFPAIAEGRKAEQQYSPDELAERYLSLHDEPIVQKMIDPWKRSDVETIEQILREANQQALRDRHDSWLDGHPEKGRKGLVQIIRETKEPVCIAVGSTHLFGKYGLIRAFQAEGFSVEPVPAEPRIPRSRL